MLRPYIPDFHYADNAVNMVRHDNKFIQANIWEMLRYFQPAVPSNSSKSVKN